MKYVCRIIEAVRQNAADQPFADAYKVTALLKDPVERDFHDFKSVYDVHRVTDLRITFTVQVPAQQEHAYVKDNQFEIELLPHNQFRVETA
jgi:hypothetical protein